MRATSVYETSVVGLAYARRTFSARPCSCQISSDQLGRAKVWAKVMARPLTSYHTGLEPSRLRLTGARATCSACLLRCGSLVLRLLNVRNQIVQRLCAAADDEAG